MKIVGAIFYISDMQLFFLAKGASISIFHMRKDTGEYVRNDLRSLWLFAVF